MDQQKNIILATLLLSSVAGFCDTVTFVAGHAIFSAHVTGNFILFAAQAVLYADASEWIKLLTFPVFVIAVMIGGWMAGKTSRRYFLLLTEGLMLIVAGAIAFGLGSGQDGSYLVVMLTVFAMGLQNAFGRLFGKETHGPTTMMTGNVTQASLDLGNLLWKGFKTDILSRESLKKQLLTIGGFLTGCLLGAILGKTVGLEAICIPGLAIIICYVTSKQVKQDGQLNIKE